MKKISAYSIIAAILIGGCRTNDSAEELQDELSAREVLDANNIQTGKIERQVLAQSISITARIEAPPQSTAQVYPVIGAYVREVYVIKGQKVKQGEKLAKLYHPDIQALQETYLSALIALEQSEKDYTRKQHLIEEQAVSEKELQAASAAYFSAKSETRSLANTLRVMGVSPDKITSGQLEQGVYLLAPIPGNILDTRAGIGQYAGNGAPLFTIVNNDHLHLELQVPPSYIDRVHPGNPVEFRTRTRKEVLYGEVYLVNAVADESGFFNVHAHFQEGQGVLHPGTYAEANIIYASDTLYALPMNAIWHEDGVAYVKVVENDHFVDVPVVTGLTSENFVAIIDHQVLKGKEVVMNGVKYLQEATSKGHAH